MLGLRLVKRKGRRMEKVEKVGEVLRVGCIVVLLFFNSVLDMRKKEISLCSLLLLGMVGVGLNIGFRYQSFAEAAGGAGVGLVLLLLSAATRGMVGLGDGLLLCVAGIYLGFWETFGLLTAGLLCVFLVSGIGLLSGKMGKKDRLPFVPFLCAAFLIKLCWLWCKPV